MNREWIFLVLAGIFEVGFTTSLKLSENFSRSIYVGTFLISATLSFYFLAEAMKAIPLGTAYAVWTGIGAVGTAIVGILFFKDDATFPRLCFLILLVGSIIGLKMASASS